jgi:hypothetical protein
MRKGRLITVDSPKGLQRQAMGGEVIHLQVEEKRLEECRRFLELLPQVSGVQVVMGEPGGLHILVEDSGREIPLILSILKVQLGITPKIAEPYVPTFDEVFVRLIQATEKDQHEVAVQ